MKIIRIKPWSVVAITANLICTLANMMYLIGTYVTPYIAILIGIIGIGMIWASLENMTPTPVETENTVFNYDAENAEKQYATIKGLAYVTIVAIIINMLSCTVACYMKSVIYLILLLIVEAIGIAAFSRLVNYNLEILQLKTKKEDEENSREDEEDDIHCPDEDDPDDLETSIAEKFEFYRNNCPGIRVIMQRAIQQKDELLSIGESIDEFQSFAENRIMIPDLIKQYNRLYDTFYANYTKIVLICLANLADLNSNLAKEEIAKINQILLNNKQILKAFKKVYHYAGNVTIEESDDDLPKFEANKRMLAIESTIPS